MDELKAVLETERPIIQKRSKSLINRKTLEFYMFISPWFIVFLVLGLIPLLYGLYISFTNFTGYNLDHLRNIGFHNYIRAFKDDDTWYSLSRQFIITVIGVPIGTAMGLMLAVLLNQKVKGLALFRTIIYLPSIVPIAASGLLWRTMFASTNGIFNTILQDLGLPTLQWLGYDFATMSLLIFLMWGAGGGLIIYLAALKAVPAELYEAAEIDGAKPFSQLRLITIPIISPVIFFNVVLGVISSLQIYIQPIILSTSGGTGMLGTPIRPNYLYSVHAFQQIFSFNRFGYGLSLIWIMFLIIMVMTLVIFSSSKYWVYYENEGRN